MRILIDYFQRKMRMEEIRDEGYGIEWLNDEGEWIELYRCLTANMVDETLDRLRHSRLTEKKMRVREFTSQVIDWTREN